MGDYIAAPLSRVKIRELALWVRKEFNLENDTYFPVVEFLEVMPDIFSGNDFTFEIIEDKILPSSVQGDTDIANHHMRIKQSVYDGACEGCGRDRFSIAHEIGHYFLMNVMMYTFQRSISQRSLKAYEDPEWQANCFAGELLMPYHLLKDASVDELVNRCKVSYDAASTQLKAFKK